MSKSTEKALITLAKKEGWEVDTKRVLRNEREFDIPIIFANGKEFPLRHPYEIYLNLYRDEPDPNLKYNYMKAIHDILWPQHIPTWHHWTEQRFMAHCMGYKHIVQASGSSTGKAQPLWEHVLTPTGFVEMGSLKVGDIVCTPDGNTSRIKSIHPQGIRPCYEVHFSDNTKVTCDENHLWEIHQISKPSRQNKLLPTRELYALLDKGKLKDYRLPKRSVAMFNSQPVPLDPYILAVILGDGSLSSQSNVGITICNKDLDIIAKVIDRCARAGINWTNRKTKNTGSVHYGLLQLWSIIENLNLAYTRSYEKHIPQEYLINSEEVRWEVLRGLIDTDGYVDKNGAVDYSTSSKQLADDIMFLVRSLGGECAYTAKVPYFTAKGVKKAGRLSYRITIRGLTFTGLCARKQSRIRHDRRFHGKNITAIIPVKAEYTQCITLVDPKGLYITRDFATTHNSHDTAKIACIFWLSDPKNNACVIASTTLESLESRIWGYVMDLINDTAIPIFAKTYRGKPPRVMYPGQFDKVHGMFAVAVRSGDDEKVVSTLIGRHPKRKFMAILDEATDMNPAIIKVIPNWQQGVEFFQLWAIGNSSSKNNLHGALATPKHKNGWDSLDPSVDEIWETKHDNGICMYFNPHKSPAILERDPVKKLELGKFLITEDKLAAQKEQYGEHTAAYNRFVLGFWSANDMDETILSKNFLEENNVMRPAEWSGFIPLRAVAGLDPAFQTGGTGCVLRIAYFGQTTSGAMALDYRGKDLLFRIQISVNDKKSGELQLAEQVVGILNRYNIPITQLAIDISGVGRALGELIKLVMGATADPIRILSVGVRKSFGKQATTDPFLLTKTPSDLWFDFRKFVQTKQIRGLDDITAQQMCNRLVEMKNGKLQLEKKDSYKARMAAISPKHAHSPDEADAAILALQAAILSLGFTPGQHKELPNLDMSQLWARKMFAHVQENMNLELNQKPVNARPVLVPNFSCSVEDSLGASSDDD